MFSVPRFPNRSLCFGLERRNGRTLASDRGTYATAVTKPVRPIPTRPPAARFLSRERNRGKSAAGLRPCTPVRRALKRRGQRRGGEKVDGKCASVPLTILRATLVCFSGCPSPHRRRYSTYPAGGCIPAHVTWSRCFVQNSRPPSCVSRWGSKGAEPLSPSGRDSKGDRISRPRSPRSQGLRGEEEEQSSTCEFFRLFLNRENEACEICDDEGSLWRLSFSDFFPRRKEIGPPEASSD